MSYRVLTTALHCKASVVHILVPYLGRECYCVPSRTRESNFTGCSLNVRQVSDHELSLSLSLSFFQIALLVPVTVDQVHSRMQIPLDH